MFTVVPHPGHTACVLVASAGARASVTTCEVGAILAISALHFPHFTICCLSIGHPAVVARHFPSRYHAPISLLYASSGRPVSRANPAIVMPVTASRCCCRAA